ncbi:MAG: 4'-phosphopantetheinyl transferase superfamily protein [Caldilineales bacterium]|nr:4'-phosphopantetheinyl transferase superfamily protein [Caldilineales bacterium]
MLLHLLQTLAASPTLAEGIAPPGLLHPTEQAHLDAFRVVKRRRDWLLGRWTAKHLVQQYLMQIQGGETQGGETQGGETQGGETQGGETQGGETQGGETPPLRAILILAAPDGAPYAALADNATRNTQHAITNLQSPISTLPLSLSISHSADRAFCALTDEPETTVGADIERIEPREPGFVEQFFTPAEIAAVGAVPPDQRDTLITAIWSAKEAVLKALRVGLRADTRLLTCCFPSPLAPSDGWGVFRTQCDASLLSIDQPFEINGWWRCDDGFVMTLATIAN